MVANKEIMAKNIIRLMKQKNVNATVVCQDLNIRPNTFSDWIHAKSYPRIDKIELMANYFGVSKAALVEEVSHVEDLTPGEVDFLNAYRNSDYVTKSAIDRLIAYYLAIQKMNPEKKKNDIDQ